MQKLGQVQTIQQKLSPQQIQFIKLLQIPTAELQARIEEELEINPALEEGREEKEQQTDNDTPNTETDTKDDYDNDSEIDSDDFEFAESLNKEHEYEDLNFEDYINNDDISGYKMQGDGNNYREEDDRESPLATSSSLIDNLVSQLGFVKLTEREYLIANHLIGTIDDDGYMRRPISSIVNDLAFLQNLETEEHEILAMLKVIQQFEPAGIAAQNLQECLILQLSRKITENPLVAKAQEVLGRLYNDYINERYQRIQERLKLNDHDFREVITIVLHIKGIEMLQKCFEEFTKKHFDKIQRRLDLNDDDLKDIVDIILHLNPKPGESSGNSTHTAHYIIPDFILKTNNHKIELSLNGRNAPELRINNSYSDMMDAYNKSQKKDRSARETLTFVKQKLDAAKWFIDAIKQRQQTLLRTMNAIIEFQFEFFLDGDESKFKPMILKDIAERIGMDISTISRVANSKTIQTEFGIFPLKYFFSEGISTESGEDVSSREVKTILKELVEHESKRKPLSDDKLEKELKKCGYQIARRTVAKYREQLNIPVARLRKEL